MAAPAGYVPLDLVGFTDKGAYVSESTYAANDIVHNDNKMYRSLQDNNTGHALPVSPETETEWWELWLSGGAEDLEAITVKDTSNVTGGGAGKVVVAQTLIDAIAQKVMNDLVAKSMIDNNLLGTDATHVLASPQGKALDEKITQLYSKLASGIATSDSTGTVTIVFDPSFKTAPSVCAIPYGSSADTAITVKVNELTAERCVLKVISAQNGGSVSALPDSRIYWIALSKSQYNR